MNVQTFDIKLLLFIPTKINYKLLNITLILLSQNLAMILSVLERLMYAAFHHGYSVSRTKVPLLILYLIVILIQTQYHLCSRHTSPLKSLCCIRCIVNFMFYYFYRPNMCILLYACAKCFL